MNKSQIKSKKRVADHGEVFTDDREVNAMLDLVGFECERLESRFLEPACGDGNFLVKILDRKLKHADKISKSLFEWQLNVAIIFSSLYGVELLNDNTIECRKRLFEHFLKNFYMKKSKKEQNVAFLNTIKYFLETNIICGDALSMKDSQGKPLIFPEWGWIGNKIQRRDFALSGLVEESKQAYVDLFDDQISLFESAPDEDFENAGLIKENTYPLRFYLELGELYEKSRL